MLALGACVSSPGGVTSGGTASSVGSIERYLKKNEVEENIQRCMQRREVCVGMSKRQVRLVMKERTRYEATPTAVKHTDGRERWIYEPYPDGDVVTVVFSHGEVAQRRPL